MRKLAQISLVLVVSILLSGCFIKSINPFYTDNAVTAIPEIQGKWHLTARGNDAVSDQYKKPWAFSDSSIETFEKGIGSTLETKYFKMDEDVFVDLFPGEPKEEEMPNEWWTIHVLPVHSVCKVSITNDSLSLTPLNGGWIVKMIEKKEVTLSHASTDPDGDDIVLTASSKELMAFLKKHKDNPEVFSKDNSHIFKREKISNKPDAGDGK